MFNKFVKKISYTSNTLLKKQSPLIISKANIRLISNVPKTQPSNINTSSIINSITRSFKTRTSVKKRCPDCYFVTRKGVLKVYCKKSPRHKQTQG
ncbi:putative mitochondrial 54S ribosomal protein [Hanseniaspora uvarum]|nr:putative mitochondrial 54S ribosomal protein [Hanseniaspora uvarum]